MGAIGGMGGMGGIVGSNVNGTIASAQKLVGKIEPTGGDWVFKPHTAGVLTVPGGEQSLKITTNVKGTEAMQLERITLHPAR